MNEYQILRRKPIQYQTYLALFPTFRFLNIKTNLALCVARLPGVDKPEQNQEWNHGSHHQESQVHQPFLGSSLCSEDLASLGLQEEDCDTKVLNRF